MPILKELPGAPKTLNTLIHRYNLTPHDNDEKRTAALHKILDQVHKVHMNHMEHKITAWMETPEEGLNSHLNHYHIQDTFSASKTLSMRDTLMHTKTSNDGDEEFQPETPRTP